MSDRHTTQVNFITESDGQWRMVLVEQGPWVNDIESELRRLQDRLYGCIDAAIDGELAAKFPRSKGAKLIIQVDCYDLPEGPVTDFFKAFSNGVFRTPVYAEALERNSFINDISLELNLRMGDRLGV